MRCDQSVFRGFGLALLAVALYGCSMDAAMTSCADCGEVRSITPHVLRTDIRLYTSAPEPSVVKDVADQFVYQVRVRMDRGGSRDFVLPRAAQRVGDRVEIRGGELVVQSRAGLVVAAAPQ